MLGRILSVPCWEPTERPDAQAAKQLPRPKSKVISSTSRGPWMRARFWNSCPLTKEEVLQARSHYKARWVLMLTPERAVDLKPKVVGSWVLVLQALYRIVFSMLRTLQHILRGCPVHFWKVCCDSGITGPFLNNLLSFVGFINKRGLQTL